MSFALVVGGGPAGLMAAEALLTRGVPVVLAEAKPSVGRKFLMAGKSGLNLTKIEPAERFHAAYGSSAEALRPMLDAFGPEQVKAWTEALGQKTFAGSTGRLFPTAMKASPLLRAWLARLDAAGLDRRTRWRWTGWDGDATTFDTADGAMSLTPAVTVLALGGASWARLGSDGLWAGILSGSGVGLAPFQPSNAGLRVSWSGHMHPHFGTPLKAIALRAGPLASRGEAMLSARGLEGGGLYPLTPALRDGAALEIDLLPDLSLDEVARRLSRPQGKQSLTAHLRKTLKLTPPALALLQECARPLPRDPAALAGVIKALAVPHEGPRPMDEAISTAGGVPFAELDAGLMLRRKPGVFCGGEMLDWEAPTGGYLLTACMATGSWAGRHAADHFHRKTSRSPEP
ncbi:TIGR03862 family flavoprotein [Thalassococcus sp. CAU 1522]|uniref:TIGR03862 family flavoprotein n=1 Tax=Thalassococcus arenae TaxID=2851652 RepID=A0ABS6N490_9RHOB|nr:TIGR03862 family flavoprotein [Thalassococcus arenae]MBV2358834.1 TIGR03862 family flavoprotein [Thalassococcus arenae]